jgi:hypothetical protein
MKSPDQALHRVIEINRLENESKASGAPLSLSCSRKNETPINHQMEGNVRMKEFSSPAAGGNHLELSTLTLGLSTSFSHTRTGSYSGATCPVQNPDPDRLQSTFLRRSSVWCRRPRHPSAPPES